MKPIDIKQIHQVRINNLDRWETEYMEKRYIKDKNWKMRVLNPIAGNLGTLINYYAKNRLYLPYKQCHVRQIFINKNQDAP